MKFRQQELAEKQSREEGSRRLCSALLCSAEGRFANAFPVYREGRGNCDVWDRNVGTRFQLPGHCQQQCSIPKTRELGKAEKNKINEHARWRGRAVLCLCKTLFTMWTQTGLRQGLGL